MYCTQATNLASVEHKVSGQWWKRTLTYQIIVYDGMNVYVITYAKLSFLIFLTWKKVQVPIGSPKFDGLIDNLGQFKKRKQGPRVLKL